jgi:hypothetical protein
MDSNTIGQDWTSWVAFIPVIAGLAAENGSTTSFTISQISFFSGVDSQRQFSSDVNYVVDHDITDQQQYVSNNIGSEVVSQCSKR